MQIIKNTFNDEHRQLLIRINQFCDKLAKPPLDHEMIFMISEVHAVLAAHFKQEEEIMRLNHDSNYTKHKVDHDSLLDEIKGLMENVDSGLTEKLGRTLAERCAAWLAVHFESHDKDFLVRGESTEQIN